MKASAALDRIWNRFFDFTYMFWRNAYSAEGKRKYDLEHFGYPTKPDVEKPFFCSACGHQLERMTIGGNDPFGNTFACPVCVPSAFRSP